MTILGRFILPVAWQYLFVGVSATNKITFPPRSLRLKRSPAKCGRRAVKQYKKIRHQTYESER